MNTRELLQAWWIGKIDNQEFYRAMDKRLAAIPPDARVVVDEARVLAACNGYDAAAKLDGETGECAFAQYPWMYCALTAALTQEQPND